MTMMETSSLLYASGSVVLDVNGQGTVILQPGNANERWTISSTSVRQQGTAVKNPLYNSYVGAVTPNQAVDGSYSGNQDDSDTVIEIPYGSYFTGQWTGGDIGATLTIVVRGTRYQRR